SYFCFFWSMSFACPTIISTALAHCSVILLRSEFARRNEMETFQLTVSPIGVVLLRVHTTAAPAESPSGWRTRSAPSLSSFFPTFLMSSILRKISVGWLILLLFCLFLTLERYMMMKQRLDRIMSIRVILLPKMIPRQRYQTDAMSGIR